ncbi:major facilitator superfamily domain-containing protein 4A isoform X4 [Cololabis saira]|uniref:major facilitator superfamily domain-containing protein 4A isoform X4 n=1 Tax=Cololabis saira TaxID=129043 RepID=UPI002AD2EBB0|nr:major facilitator superfamily domain-containing protein 4A isoform X4 [Cololabis saira]
MQLQDGGFCSPFRRNLQQTLTYWSVFFSFGLCIAFLGPTILDLRCQTQSSLQQITWGFFCQQVSLLGGSGLGGQLRNSLVTSLTALLCSTLVISLMFAIIPFCHHVILLSVAMGLGGLAMGVIDTIANLQLVKLYQKDSAIALQALHFFIGLGALISPLVTEPFLSEDSCVLGFNSTTNTSSSWNLHHLRNTLAGSGAALHNTSQYPLYVEGIVVTKVAYAFWIMALINLPVPAAVLALMHHQRLLPCSSTSPRLLDREPGSHSAGDGCHGLLRRLCLHIRRVPSSADETSTSRLPGQRILGLHHGRTTGLHLLLLQIHGARADHHQSGGSDPGPVLTSLLLHQRCVSLHSYMCVGFLHQQCLPLHVGVHRGHIRLQRLCYNSPGDECQHRRDDATTTHWITLERLGMESQR